MFDIGFAELLVIGVLGLLVIGPERLPGTVRTVALWIGRLRRSFSDIRSEIEREVGADEIRRQLHNESILASLKESKDQLNKEMSKAGEGLRDIENSIAPQQNTTADEKLDSKNTPDKEEQVLPPIATEQAPNKQDPTS
ncbi:MULTISPECIES: Sec-independent protein translocase protein TatB [Zhongshania]|jgi:sec-independent protein translocase protein TatB|uniref:Sec-independent protein translocase protein TatB n=1 Tax=Zhongshania antarctica TaxID=641702 RepID=A0A840R895_9GAMM|nr:MULTISPECIES: Sec-independent protein translocase protein TatB [Zhongshania]MBB5188561.1 sec-independent protein translocase protein TatB [Zhongshania antarctica]